MLQTPKKNPCFILFMSYLCYNYRLMYWVKVNFNLLPYFRLKTANSVKCNTAMHALSDKKRGGSFRLAEPNKIGHAFL